MNDTQLHTLAHQIKTWGQELGFQAIGISDIDLNKHEAYLQQWLAQGYHGSMTYMANHGTKRSRPAELVPGTLRVISARMDYLPANTQALETLKKSHLAYVSRYALGRDYHKLIRKRLTKLGKMITEATESCAYRAFVDSAPVLEKALAEKAGLGWIGKNTLVLNKKVGSFFFLGEILTDLPLPTDESDQRNHCGTCTACLDLCPTKAFVNPYVLDARKCISYLTIESKDSIPLELRPLIGNRVFGCDDCQLVCPWNRFSKPTQEQDFQPRHQLDTRELSQLFLWGEETFDKNTLGSPIRRTGYIGWLRNLAVGLGNAPSTPDVIHALQQRANHSSELVREHVAWALNQHASKDSDKNRIPIQIHKQ